MNSEDALFNEALKKKMYGASVTSQASVQLHALCKHVACLHDVGSPHANCPSPSEPTLIAKSSLLLDVKPWDDETDMAKLEECVRSIQMDGLVWGQCKNFLPHIA